MQGQLYHTTGQDMVEERRAATLAITAAVGAAQPQPPQQPQASAPVAQVAAGTAGTAEPPQANEEGEKRDGGQVEYIDYVLRRVGTPLWAPPSERLGRWATPEELAVGIIPQDEAHMQALCAALEDPGKSHFWQDRNVA